MSPAIWRLPIRSPLAVTSSTNNGASACQAFLMSRRIVRPMKNRTAKGEVRRHLSDSGVFNTCPGLIEDKDAQLLGNVIAKPIDLQVTA